MKVETFDQLMSDTDDVEGSVKILRAKLNNLPTCDKTGDKEVTWHTVMSMVDTTVNMLEEAGDLAARILALREAFAAAESGSEGP